MTLSATGVVDAFWSALKKGDSINCDELWKDFARDENFRIFFKNYKTSLAVELALI